MKVAIPSYNRYDVKTLSHLENVECEIYLFVIEEEYEEYKNIETNVRLCLDHKGLL